MADIQGLGNCGICMKPIQDPITGVPSPVRHFKGHQLAHQRCSEELAETKESPEYKRQQLVQRIGALRNEIKNAEMLLERVEAELAELNGFESP